MRLDDGYQTLIDFAGAFGVTLWEKEVTPPGADGGGMVDVTTMRNALWRTRNAKHLKTLTDFTVTVAYDPEFYSTALAVLQANNLVFINFPDGSQLQFWGFLDKFIPNAHREGEQPTAVITVVPTNQDNTGTEVSPNFIPAP